MTHKSDKGLSGSNPYEIPAQAREVLLSIGASLVSYEEDSELYEQGYRDLSTIQRVLENEVSRSINETSHPQVTDAVKRGLQEQLKMHLARDMRLCFFDQSFNEDRTSFGFWYDQTPNVIYINRAALSELEDGDVEMYHTIIHEYIHSIRETEFKLVNDRGVYKRELSIKYQNRGRNINEELAARYWEHSLGYLIMYYGFIKLGWSHEQAQEEATHLTTNILSRVETDILNALWVSTLPLSRHASHISFEFKQILNLLQPGEFSLQASELNARASKIEDLVRQRGNTEDQQTAWKENIRARLSEYYDSETLDQIAIQLKEESRIDIFDLSRATRISNTLNHYLDKRANSDQESLLNRDYARFYALLLAAMVEQFLPDETR